VRACRPYDRGMPAAPERRPHPVRGAQPAHADGVIEIGPFELRDAPAVAIWDADPETQRWFDWPAQRPAGHDWLASARTTVVAKWAAWESGDELAFIIREAAGGHAIGWCDLRLREGRCAEISYGVNPQSRGRGIATRAVVLLCRFAFETLGAACVELNAGELNAASRRVAEKAGFRPIPGAADERTYQHYQPLLGRRYRSIRYRLVPDDRPRSVR